MKAITLKTIRKTFFILFFLSLCISCSQYDQAATEAVSLESVDLNGDYDALGSTMKTDFKFQHDDVDGKGLEKPNFIKNLKIIKTAATRYKVKNLYEALTNIKALIHENGGYISELRLDNDTYKKENKFTIKIPNKNFDTVLDTIRGYAEFTDYVNISTQDMTEEYVDMQTRLKTKLEVKKRLEAVMRKNAKTVEDILSTESHLRAIQEEIEAVQGKLKYITNRVAFSTINIELYETVDYTEAPTVYNKSFFTEVGEALSFGWEFVKNIVLGLLHIWPFVILGTFVFVLLRRKFKRRK